MESICGNQVTECKTLSIIYHLKKVARLVIYFPLVKMYRKSRNKNLINDDIVRWIKEYNVKSINLEDALTKLLFNPIFRNLFYFRNQNCLNWIKKLYPYDQTFFISPSCEIKGGLFFWHPMSTYLYAKKIGKNVTIRQLTTFGNLGEKDKEARPIIGDNVDIGVNVTIIGDVRIGNNVKIGAGSVIVKDVPDDCTVVGNPAYIVKKNGQKVTNPLS